jgi:hypothetical protein
LPHHFGQAGRADDANVAVRALMPQGANWLPAAGTSHHPHEKPTPWAKWQNQSPIEHFWGNRYFDNLELKDKCVLIQSLPQAATRRADWQSADKAQSGLYRWT